MVGLPLEYIIMKLYTIKVDTIYKYIIYWYIICIIPRITDPVSSRISSILENEKYALTGHSLGHIFCYFHSEKNVGQERSSIIMFSRSKDIVLPSCLKFEFIEFKQNLYFFLN